MWKILIYKLRISQSLMCLIIWNTSPWFKIDFIFWWLVCVRCKILYACIVNALKQLLPLKNLRIFSLSLSTLVTRTIGWYFFFSKNKKELTSLTEAWLSIALMDWACYETNMCLLLLFANQLKYDYIREQIVTSLLSFEYKKATWLDRSI